MYTRSVCQLIGWCFIALVTAGCGGGAAFEHEYVVNEDATVRRATASRFKYCNIQAERLCQSPDSQLVFQLPLRIRMSAGYPEYSEHLIIYNDGVDRVSIGSYEIKVLDNKGRVYYPQFSGPNGYDEESPVFPALVLEPKEDAAVRFWGELNREQGTGLKGVSVTYTLVGENEPTTVLVSYQPSRFSELDPQPEPYEQGR